jgi:biotin-[acetyl-CoA-carboxylase] ligase BirA-like protein
MQILSDCPENLNWLMVDRCQWRQIDWHADSYTYHALFRALTHRRQGWITKTESMSGEWDTVIIIDNASDSQFDVLRELAKIPEIMPKALICSALNGKGFHGHRKRCWIAERGNLHLSMYYRARIPVTNVQMAFSMLPAVAAVDAIHALDKGLPTAGIKWINDIHMCGRKIAGVLTSTQVENNWIEGVILGIGLNIAKTPAIPPNDFVPAIGHLNEFSGRGEIHLYDVFDCVLKALHERLTELLSEGIGPLLNSYREHSICIGKQVAIWDESVTDLKSAKPKAMGRVLAINSDLSLTIEGYSEPVSSGRLTFVEE